MVAPELIKAAQSGDRDALITLLREIETHVYRTAYYILGNEQDAMDAAQEALIRIYTKIGSYEEKAQFKTWVQRIVTNLCIDKFRRAKPTVSIEQHDLTFTDHKSVEDEVLSAYVAQDIREAIDKLPEHHRSVVVLRYLQDFSYNEIAESLDLPINTVKSYLFRARQQLQTILGEYKKPSRDAVRG
ncbi:ECF subfamily RNA polymerase sigma-24 subunit [Paenibacillus mucilaginosus 3016]|uniref:ECF subfamily RNA polymerase sigma-24 subunit n=1 Tax=Paenibacillus mucilaginosus 3016 TaxID=1116391 RepID=H6NII8_9BACL|nr:sigma-70 family RNA polymerase sigma factor [Paenibacillus mucilaginosus]AFC32299.1 ECF subfamily RNA polymerase sigma-24 subunit [Paenibacillus mucilaginosus 3016]WFA20798.1 sigma-70 family RNA polymerase sigma factor [Paenibacillus mucilaginosus]